MRETEEGGGVRGMKRGRDRERKRDREREKETEGERDGHMFLRSNKTKEFCLRMNGIKSRDNQYF